jgi:four helix bundle protein
LNGNGIVLSQSSKLRGQSQSSKVKTGLRERSYTFSIMVVKFIGALPERSAYRILSDQLLRSATSIGANVIEAKAASSKRDFIRYYEIALKSANETAYWLGLLKDALNINTFEINDLLRENEELSKMLAASLLTLKER